MVSVCHIDPKPWDPWCPYIIFMLNPKTHNLELTHKVSTRRRLFKRRFCYRPHTLETKKQPTQSPTFSLSTTFLEAYLDKSHAPFIKSHPNAQSSFPASDGLGERPCFQIGSYLEPLSSDKCVAWWQKLSEGVHPTLPH
jgi:hypothetical protein